MTVRLLKLSVLVMFALVTMGADCRKKKSTLDEPPPPPPVEDTVAVEPQTMPSVDTSDEVSFREAELEAEFQRKVSENLQTVYFDYDSYVLKEETMRKLAVAASFLTEHATLRVLIEGHCDERGSSEYNMGLGENRARSVKEYLVNYGIPSIQLEITSWGKERPEMPNCTDDPCHSRNRRTEFKVLAQ